jgi:branched-chain amino acid transport system permease protein
MHLTGEARARGRRPSRFYRGCWPVFAFSAWIGRTGREAGIMLYFIEQCLNGVQLGMLLFLLAAGLTLIFGIMDLVNLAHGSLYMIGAYFAATFAALTGSFIAGALLALLATLLVGMAVEVIAIRRLYGRDHLDHVLGTFGLLLFFNELVRLIWGPAGMTLPLPSQMLTAVQVLPGVYYPLYRLVIILATLVVALLLYVLVMRTRIGMLIRAGASNREMVGALGVNIKLLYTLVFGLGAALAGFAGLMQAPILTVQIGMGENILILAFVVIIIGGIGSIRGAFVASIFVGLIDTVGRAFLPDLLRLFLSTNAASSAGPAISSMLIYMLMAAVLVFRPEGLFPASSK